MAQVRTMHEHEAERVRDLWLQMCADAGTPLSQASARRILTNLEQYATHQEVCCFVAEAGEALIGFLTGSVTGHPIMPGRSGEIEELYVQPGPHRQAIQMDLVRQAVIFMQTRGASSIHTRIGIGDESPEEGAQRSFWRSLGWENDMTIYSIYSNVPGDPALQHVWDEYQVHHHPAANEQQS